MRPNNPNYTEDAQVWANRCDDIIERAIQSMQNAGVPDAMIVDRMLTYASSHCVHLAGKDKTATVLLRAAEAIAGGAFDKFTGEGQTRN